MYRAYGLAPGEYVVAASTSAPRADRITYPSAAAIDALLRGLPSRSGSAARATDDTAIAYAPVFYPGTPVAQDAARIRVAAGETREGLDFAFDPVRTARLQGRLVMEDGTPIPAIRLSLDAVGPPLPVFLSLSLGSQQSPDGTFAFWNVTPGHYVLFASGTPGNAPFDSSSGRSFYGGAEMGALWAMTEIDVNGIDIGNITLTMKRALKFSGRVAFDGVSLAPPGDPTRISVSLTRVETAGFLVSPDGLPADGQSPRPAAVDAAGMFTITGVAPGKYAAWAFAPNAPGWTLRSAMVSGRDILDSRSKSAPHPRMSPMPC